MLRWAALMVAALGAGAAGGAPAPAEAQQSGAPATRAVYLDGSGVVRWRDDRREVALFGANYVLPTASDYRAAGYLHADRRKMIEEDMAQFARMGWDGLRLTFWGDWEAADSVGNLLHNDHLDLLDWLIARARERGIYLLFSPIQLYNANWPDALADTTAPGFARRFSRERMGVDPAAIAAQTNYLRQILTHVNPYTRVAIKDEPAILFIELVNEPVHHVDDLAGSVRYIDALTDAVRATGCRKLVFYNVSQDFRIAPAILRSRAQGVTFGWYPTGLNAGHELEGNYLRAADDYPDMRRPDLARLPRIVYEFDSPDLRTATMYPAMARSFRAVGAQFAAMFAYDMLATASRNLGWQTHYLNLVYTPRKAMSAVIAAEAMRRLPRLRSYGEYPRNTRFGDFRIDPDSDRSELVARDAMLYAGATRSTPPAPGELRRVAGYGSSPVVRYDGEGTYFLDRVRRGVWRLEVYPDAVSVRDPFGPPAPDRIATRAIARAWPMAVDLPDLGGEFTVQPIAAGNADPTRATAGRFSVTPGVYVLSATGPLAPAALPRRLGAIGFTEFHRPAADTLPPTVMPLIPPSVVGGRDRELRASVVDTAAPDSVLLFARPAGGDAWRMMPMRAAGGYEYGVRVPRDALAEGPHQLAVTLVRGDSALTFPGGVRQRPTDWNFDARGTWPLDVVGERSPVPLFDPATDAARLAFTRIGDAGRRGLYRIGRSDISGRAVFHFALPMDSSGWSPADYTASLVVADRIRARGVTLAAGQALGLRLRGLGARQTLHVTLMEDDGTSWTAAVTTDSTWSDRVLLLDAFALGQGVKLPQGFPGEWNYWVGPAEGRGGAGDRPRVEHIERLQLSLRREAAAVAPDGYGVEVEWAVLDLGGD